MNEIQKVELNLLKEFVKVCEKNNLRYFMVGGSALGCVRHKGFIPWDDDIDVAMPREDYEKFMKMQDELPSYCFIQNYKTDPHYIYNYGKLRDSRTTFIESYYKYHRINHGVWIDIFPLDGISSKMKPSKKFAPKLYYFWFNVWMMYLPSLFRKPKKGTIIKDLFFNLVALLTCWLNLFHLRNKWVDKLMVNPKFDESVMIANCLGKSPSKEAMPSSFFGKGVKIQFEDIEVNCPSDYDGYFQWLFGDYMKLPPEEQRVGHHYNKGFSLTQGYQDYIKEHKI